MKNRREISIFLNGEAIPFGQFEPPAKLVLDTTKIPDGKHTLKIVATSSSGVQGIKEIPFEVRNGPEIAVVGLKENEVLESKATITINAYGNEDLESFVVQGSETPKAIPSWIWALLIAFLAFALFYFITTWNADGYQSFF